MLPDTSLKKYSQRVTSLGSQLCIGLDSDVRRLPEQFAHHRFPQFAFNRWIIDQTAELAAAYKPNTAFYEAQGEHGIQALKMTMEYLHINYPEILTIGDAKRADIDSTNEGYAQFLYEYLGFDAVTVNPYLGRAALGPLLKYSKKLTFVLCRTSNKDAGEFQDLPVGRECQPLWETIAAHVREQWSLDGDCGIVMGATQLDELARARALVGELPILVPGVGVQGGDAHAVMQAGATKDGGGLIINVGRAILFAQNPEEEAKKYWGECQVNRR